MRLLFRLQQVVGRSTGELGVSSKNMEGDAQMSDVALAAQLVRRAAGRAVHGEKVKVAQERAYRAISKQNPDKWTRRRVRSLWGQEAQRIEHREIEELLRAVAEVQSLERARNEHAEFVRETARMADVLSAQVAHDHSRSLEAIRRLSCRLAGA